MLHKYGLLAFLCAQYPVMNNLIDEHFAICNVGSQNLFCIQLGFFKSLCHSDILMLHIMFHLSPACFSSIQKSVNCVRK